MIQINKTERDYLEEIGVLKVEQGRYKGLAVCSKSKRSNGKSFYVEDWMASYLKGKLVKK